MLNVTFGLDMRIEGHVMLTNVDKLFHGGDHVYQRKSGLELVIWLHLANGVLTIACIVK